MEADFRALQLGRIDAGQVFTGQKPTYSWDFVKENGGITLLSSRHPKGGLCYKVVEQYATAYEQQIYPTQSNKSKDGNAEVERDAATAFHKFQEMVSTGAGTSSSATGITTSLAISFDDLDTKLTTLAKFDKKLVIEIQRTGINDFGAKKATLDLRYLENAIRWNKEKDLRDAVVYYRSYDRKTRIAALKDMRESILMDYMEPSVMAEIIRANRALRKQYAMSEFEGSLDDFSSDRSSHILPDTTYASFSVRFLDQLGKEIPNLPYITSTRGAINYRESWLKTNGGKDPAQFASGATLFESSEDAVAGRHYLYRYKVNDEVPHRGSFKVQIILPEFDNNSPWANPRLKVYGGTPDTVNDREGSIIPAKAGIILTSQAFTFMGPGSHTEIGVPVYREPIPNHLVDAGDGTLVSKWSSIADVNRLPSHQKVKLRLRISRLKQSILWEKADKNADGVITQDEYQSPEGEAARNDLDLESKIPVRGVSVELRPSPNNTWLASRNAIMGTTDLSGSVSLTAPFGEYAIIMASQNDTGTPTENQIGRIEVPAGAYYRDTTPHDTTPIGLVGATMIEATSTVVGYRLTASIPPLPKNMKAEYGTVYAIKSLPGIETGWPNNSGTETSDTIFDEFEVILPPLPGEVELSDEYEDLEAQAEQEKPLEFGQSITLTQESTGAVVTGIDPTEAGTKWTVTRLALKKNSAPTVAFSNQYDPSAPTDEFGDNRYATASIMFPRAVSMGEGEDVLVFYPQTSGPIVAYPTESVVIGTPGTGQNYTMEITDTEAVSAPEPTVSDAPPSSVSDALPVPAISEQSAADAARFESIARAQAPDTPTLPSAVQDALARLSNPDWAPPPAPATPVVSSAPPSAASEAARFAARAATTTSTSTTSSSASRAASSKVGPGGRFSL